MQNRLGICACGCGAEVSGTWKQGHNPKNLGRTFTEEHRRRLSESIKLQRSQEGANPGNTGHAPSAEARARMSAARKGRFHSDKPKTIHVYVNRTYPKSGICEECGAVGKTDYASLTLHSYTRNREDYAELCRSCHQLLDYRTGERSR
jgi:hypothetical protein